MIARRGTGIPLMTLTRHGRSPLAFVLLAGMLLLTCASPSLAKRSREGWSPRDNIGFQLQYDAGYDSNILELSPNEIDQFTNRTLPLVTDVRSYDDFVQNVGFKANIASPKWWGWRRAHLTYSFSYVLYGKNSYNNRAIHNVYASTDLINRVDLFGSYLLIPNRYLRDYYDRDYGSIAASEFGYNLGGAGLRWSPKAVRGLSLALRYEGYTIYYNPRFTEYDTEGWGLRLDGRYRVSRSVELNVTLKKRWSDNVGFTSLPSDGSVNSGLSEYGDGSYGEEWYEVSVDYRTPRLLGRRWDMEGGARFRHRYYTSDQPLDQDPIHRGRKHLHSRFSFTMTSRLFGHLEGGPVIEYEMRRTSSPLDWVKRAKDFNAFRAGVTLAYIIW